MIISFQGAMGAYSDLACQAYKPGCIRLACDTFEDVLQAVHQKKADFALIPVDNSLAGRVADIHHLLPHSNLHIIGEFFLAVEHQLLAPKGASLKTIKRVHSHIHALSQCRKFLGDRGYQKIVHADTAGAARDVAKLGGIEDAAIASRIAADVYGLETMMENIHDAEHNTTRFLLMSPYSHIPEQHEDCMTTLVFQVRNIPASLYKALGGFATNGVNLVKLESYLIGGSFTAAQFYVDIDGHVDATPVKNALEELRFFSHEVKVMGVYLRHPYRNQ